MNENYLHFLWKTKRLPFHEIKTSDNKEIFIKHVGYHNTNESGPDFTNGKIVIDGLEWCGNIELHVKSSDWYLHKHQNDLAFNNVILHVVYENDCDVYIDNIVLPVIELKDYIDWEHFERYQYFNFNNKETNCAKIVSEIDRIYIESMMERSIVDRLNKKVNSLNQDVLSKDPGEIFYFLLARAFGTKVNQLPFEELTYRLPLSVLKKLSKKKQVSLLISTSGILPLEDKNINQVAHESWKRKGLRPRSFPEIRINQFALIVSQFDFNMLYFMKSSKDLYSFFITLFNSISVKAELRLQISQQLIDLIIINCVVPFLWCFGDSIEDVEMKEKAIELLQIIPPEKNVITKKWNSYGVKAKSAYESQALISLYNEYCIKNKCLSCDIGNHILKH